MEQLLFDPENQPNQYGFSSRDAHALVLCEHLRAMGANIAIIPIEWEGVNYVVSVERQTKKNLLFPGGIY